MIIKSSQNMKIQERNFTEENKKNQTDWQDEVKGIVEGGCTDSDIEDYIIEHPEVNGRDVWDFIYEMASPDECKGCKFVQMSGMYPCNVCIRRNQLKDYYKNR